MSQKKVPPSDFGQSIFPTFNVNVPMPRGTAVPPPVLPPANLDLPMPAGAALPRDTYRDALEAVLLFHSASPWTPEKQARWAKLTGEAEATTRALCDAVRRALAGLGRKR